MVAEVEAALVAAERGRALVLRHDVEDIADAQRPPHPHVSKTPPLCPTLPSPSWLRLSRMRKRTQGGWDSRIDLGGALRILLNSNFHQPCDNHPSYARAHIVSEQFSNFGPSF